MLPFQNERSPSRWNFLLRSSVKANFFLHQSVPGGGGQRGRVWAPLERLEKTPHSNPWPGSMAGSPVSVGSGVSLPRSGLPRSGAGRTAEDASRPRFRLWRTILHFRPHSLLAHVSVSAEQGSHSHCAACCAHTQPKLLAKARLVGAPLRPFCF